ncbi:MAG: Spy/CpxP family protein refolding chaperone [Burkholderiaceae bacterium]
MKCINFHKTFGTALLIGGALVAVSAMADPPQSADAPYGMGPGMMDDDGMGRGMMGNYGSGYGMGRGGMMGDYSSGYGMGRGMMGGFAPGPDLNLTAEQRVKITSIREDLRRKHWDLMGKMQDEQALMNEQYNADKRDDAAISKTYLKMSEFRHQMFDLSLNAQSQIDAVLTKEQRDKRKHG